MRRKLKRCLANSLSPEILRLGIWKEPANHAECPIIAWIKCFVDHHSWILLKSEKLSECSVFVAISSSCTSHYSSSWAPEPPASSSETTDCSCRLVFAIEIDAREHRSLGSMLGQQRPLGSELFYDKSPIDPLAERIGLKEPLKSSLIIHSQVDGTTEDWKRIILQSIVEQPSGFFLICDWLLSWIVHQSFINVYRRWTHLGVVVRFIHLDHSVSV